MSKSQSAGKPRNYKLSCGVYRFGRSKTYHKKAIYKFLKKTTPKKVVENKPAFVEKKIGGSKNGGIRMVRVKRLRNNYPTLERSHKNVSRGSSKKVHKVRASLSPGVVAIVVAGVHKGKRVIVLKSLGSGLLMVTGPFTLNGCPLRRINQRFLIATSTKLDFSSVKLPENLNDFYFRRIKDSKKPKKEGDVFEAKKEAYKPSDQRKADQKTVDNMILDVINKHPEGKLLRLYLGRSFGLSKGQYPHLMKF